MILIKFKSVFLGSGNAGPVSEYNMLVDPEAAHVVFESGIEIVMVPLEVTHTALVTQDVLDSIESIDSYFSTILMDLLLFVKKTSTEVSRMPNPPLHDPCAVAFVVDPSLFEYTPMRVDIEMASPISYGQTICDKRDRSQRGKNAHVCEKMNVDKFWKMMIDAIKLANLKSPANKV